MTKRIVESPSPSPSIAPSDSISDNHSPTSRIVTSHTVQSTPGSKQGKVNVKRRTGHDEIDYDDTANDVKPQLDISHQSTKKSKTGSSAIGRKQGKKEAGHVGQDQLDGQSNEDGPKGACVSLSKARLNADAKHAIAEEIVRRGVAALDVAELARQTGLTVTQVRSQICDNRMNLRRQLMQSIQSIQ